MYDITFELGFTYRKKNYRAYSEQSLPFIPQDGMHVGPAQILTVCQIHWMGDNRFNVDLITQTFEPETEERFHFGSGSKPPPTKTPFQTVEDVFRSIQAGCVDAPPFLDWKFYLIDWSKGDDSLPSEIQVDLKGNLIVDEKPPSTN